MQTPAYSLVNFTNDTVPEALLPYLENLTLPSGNGYMWPMFSAGKAERITVIFYEGTPVAWGIYVKDEWHDPEHNMATMLYVNPMHRRKGLGSKIIEQMSDYAGYPVTVFPHDYTSRMFFASFADNPQIERSHYFGG